MKVSQLIGAIVESSNTKKCGYILGVATKDEGKIILHCCNNNEHDFFINADNLKYVDDKFIFTKCTTRQSKLHYLRLGKKCYSTDGKYIGVLTDYELKDNRLKYAIIGTKKYKPCQIISGDIIIIKTDIYNSDKKDAQTCNGCMICPHQLLINALCY